MPDQRPQVEDRHHTTGVNKRLGRRELGLKFRFVAPSGGLYSLALALIILTYVVLAVSYARGVPIWEAPDEPAHYNYIRMLAVHGQFPTLQAGDYPAAYLEILKARRFPPDLSIAPLRYESHQPPLYYALLVPVYESVAHSPLRRQVTVLRLASVGMGVLILLIAFAIVCVLFPSKPLLALATTATIAFIPMHIAMSAAINNDTLSELILSALLLVLVYYLRDGPSRRMFLATTLLLGLGLLTKVTLTIAVPLVALGFLIREGWVERQWRRALLRLVGVYGCALLLYGPWLVHNLLIYGPGDPLVLQRQDLVARGQITTVQLIAQLHTAHPIMTVIQLWLVTSFHSFWGQFGWMGVSLDQRAYTGLGLLSALAALGLLVCGGRSLLHLGRSSLPAPTHSRLGEEHWSLPGTGQAVCSFQYWALGLLACSALAIFAGDAWYSLRFFQAQGRYLYPAIVALALGFNLGLGELLFDGLTLCHCPERFKAPLAAAVLLLGALAFISLDVIALTRFIIPQLRQ